MSVVQPVFSFKYDAAAAGIVSTSWSVMHSGIVGPIKELEIYNGTSHALDLGIGNSGAEVKIFTIFPNGNPSVPLNLAHNTRLSLRGTVTSATAGVVVINCYR